MGRLLLLMVVVLRSSCRSRADLVLENLALRQQLAALMRAGRRPRVSTADRWLWVRGIVSSYLVVAIVPATSGWMVACGATGMAPMQAIPGHASVVDPPEGHVDVAILPDQAIVARGSNRGRNSYSSTPDGVELRLFEPTTRKWQSAGSPSLSAWDDSLTALADGRALLAGGVVLSRCPSSGGLVEAHIRTCGVAQTRVEIWNRATLAFQPAAPLSTARFGHAAVLLADGRVLVVGRSLPGSGIVGVEAAAVVATAEIYDPASDRWTAAPPMHVARRYSVAIRLEDGRVLVVGDGSSEIFDPRTSTWTASVSSPPWQRAVAVSLGQSGTLMVGLVIGQATPRAAIFDGQVWSDAAGLELKSMPVAVHGDATVWRSRPGRPGGRSPAMRRQMLPGGPRCASRRCCDAWHLWQGG